MKLHAISRILTGSLMAIAMAIPMIALSPASDARAQEVNHTLTIRDGKFEPSTLQVKAGVKFKLTITNTSAKSAEFESSELNREKVVPAGGSGSIYIGPLEPGTYPFFDDFNQSNRGRIVAK